MQYSKIVCGVLAMIIGALVFAAGTAGASPPPSPLLISEIETTGSDAGGNDVPSEEFVKLTNVTGDALELNNWRLDYLSASGASVTPLATLNGAVLANGSMLVAHSGYPSSTIDMSFGSGTVSILAKSGGQVRLLDSTGAVVDMIGWGSAAVAPPWPKIVAISAGYSVKRIIPGHPLFGGGLDYTFTGGTQPMAPAGGAFLPDLCPNLPDVQTVMPAGMMASEGRCVPIPPPDRCSNLEGDQAEVPAGYGIDENGLCSMDMCLNIAGLQIAIPTFYERDQIGDCYPHDTCDNLPEVQMEIPDGMIRKNSNECGLDLVPLQLTEILPNATGSDTDREYVEIYNPSVVEVDLTPYVIRVGEAADKFYSFPPGAKIGPGEYRAFYNGVIKFTLANTMGRVVLGTVDGTILGDTGRYNSPDDNSAWAFIDGAWQYTNRPSPGQANLRSFTEDDPDVPSATSLVSCPAGKYRNPLTNRCRNIESDASILAVCDADQYRNPETGRCRKIALATAQTPCKDGQYRSEETGRCRNSTTVSALAPCKEGQERNPDTNRCRNTAAKSVPDAAFAVEPIQQGAKAFVGWWALGGVGVLALGYAGWEWRHEVVNALRKAWYLVARK